MMNVSAGMFRQHRFAEKDPEMATTPALFERRLHAILTKLVLQLQEIFKDPAWIAPGNSGS